MNNGIKLFRGNIEYLESIVNKWLGENESEIEVIRIEHHSVVTYSTNIFATVMIHYIEK